MRNGARFTNSLCHVAMKDPMRVRVRTSLSATSGKEAWKRSTNSSVLFTASFRIASASSTSSFNLDTTAVSYASMKSWYSLRSCSRLLRVMARRCVTTPSKKDEVCIDLVRHNTVKKPETNNSLEHQPFYL